MLNNKQVKLLNLMRVLRGRVGILQQQTDIGYLGRNTAPKLHLLEIFPIEYDCWLNIYFRLQILAKKSQYCRNIGNKQTSVMMMSYPAQWINLGSRIFHRSPYITKHNLIHALIYFRTRSPNLCHKHMATLSQVSLRPLLRYFS